MVKNKNLNIQPKSQVLHGSLVSDLWYLLDAGAAGLEAIAVANAQLELFWAINSGSEGYMNPHCFNSGFPLLKNMFIVPLLVLKGIYHYWTYFFPTKRTRKWQVVAEPGTLDRVPYISLFGFLNITLLVHER